MLLHYLIAWVMAVFTAEVLAAPYLRKRGQGAVAKAVALVFACLFLVAYLLDYDALASAIHFAPIAGIRFTTTGTSFVLVWLTTAAAIFTALYPFFRKKCPAADVLLIFTSAVFLLDGILLADYIGAQTGEVLGPATLRTVLFALSIGMGLGNSVFFLCLRAKTFPKKKSTYLWLFLALCGMLIAAFPNYTLQMLFDPARYNLPAKNLNLYHRLCIYPIVVVPLVLYFLLRNKSDETRRFVLLYYALCGLWNYMSTQKFPQIYGLANVAHLPLHLCNTACYITPLCLTFKWKKIFYFTYFINVFGAFIALMMPSYSTEGLHGTLMMSEIWHFYRAHYQAFYMPLLTVGLGIFARPRLKQFLWSMVGFTGYYLLVLVLNGWFSNYDAGVDFFFINSDFVADKLGAWAEGLRNFVWEFDLGGLHFRYNPVYQVLYYLTYCLLALGMWFLYELAYRSVSGWLDLSARRKKIALDKLAREVAGQGGPMDNDNGSATLVLEHLSKRYARSDVYAVSDVCLEVRGGEIFGFLGPNGAGKSTIIKSIVGIQPITDGRILVCGHDVEHESVQSKYNIGFVPDHYALYEKLTGREYVNYIADLYGVKKADRDERMEFYVNAFELTQAIDEPISTYSHGMKQKIAIMAALIHDPKVWILDEPLTGLDPNSIYQVKQCMVRHAEKGNIVFFSSHLIDVVERICDRIAIIRKGQIQCVCDVKEIEKTTTLEEYYMSVIRQGEVQPVAFSPKKGGSACTP